MNTAVLFLESAAAEYGSKAAIRTVDSELTYAEFRALSRDVGTALLNLKPKMPGISKPVIVLMKKGIDAIVSYMGILYSGNSYVPLDYDIPQSQLTQIIRSIKPDFIITDDEGVSRLGTFQPQVKVLDYSNLTHTRPNENAVDNALSLVKDSDPVYIMYTSGSTGQPKGVVIAHRGLIDYAKWVKTACELNADTVLGSQSPFAFDSIVLDIFGSLAAGATLSLIPNILFQFPDKLVEYINESDMTAIFFIPTVMIAVANSGVLARVCSSNQRVLPKLKTIIFGGEVMPTKHLNIWREFLPDSTYINLYGPTEVTVSCTYYKLNRAFDDAEPIPIGLPRENMGVIILTEDDVLAKAGETGELCVLGTGLALGYWADEATTQKVFVQNPLNCDYHERMYRTGDLAFVGEDGLMRFAGRKDSQIKMLGYRIELAEIEAAIRKIESVENACVLFDGENKKIIAFIQSKEQMTKHRLRKYLLELVPKYMFPDKHIIMDALPLNRNGKIDRSTLRGLLCQTMQ